MKVCPVCKAEYAGGEVFCPVDASRLTTPSQMAASPNPEDPLVGTTLGERYRIQRRIGEGGMGIVYEAVHVVIEKRVALKVLRDDFSSRPEVVERFRQEAKSASRIGHEHIVDISDFGETPSGQSYFVMEYLEGEDLANVLARERTLDPERAVSIARQCCRALGAAHVKGIVHRDMKPENVFLVNRGDGADFVKIVDFGIAKMSDIETPGAPGRKLTKTGMIFGTPEYMSPEQAAGKDLDHRVDVYALGVILFEMLSGRVPFVGDSFMGILTQHMFEDPPAIRDINPVIDVPAGLEGVIMRALAKDPDERFASMDRLYEEIEAAMDPSVSTLVGYGGAVKAQVRGARRVQPLTTEPGEFPARRRRSWLGWLAAAAGLAVVATGVGAWLVASPGTGTAAGEAVAVSDSPTGKPPAVAAPGAGAVPTQAAAAGMEAHDGGGEGTSVAPDGDESDAAPSEAARAAGSSLIALTVETRPAGARVDVEGRGTVCDSTPCTFQTAAGESVKVVARRGRMTASQEVQPSDDMSLEMRLTRRARRRGPRVQSSEAARGPDSDDLKVPDIFRE